MLSKLKQVAIIEFLELVQLDIEDMKFWAIYSLTLALLVFGCSSLGVV